MYKIVNKIKLNSSVTRMDVDAPGIAVKARPGQFIILRVNEKGERIPLTIADTNPKKGTVTIIFQVLGKTTAVLNDLKEGESILDFVGPLAAPSHLVENKKVAVIGGGLGVAIAYPQTKAFFNLNCQVHAISGFRNKDLIILEDEINTSATKSFIMTDDGSNGNKGFVTDKLNELILSGEKYDLVVAIGPLPMMKAVCDLTKQFGIKTIVSMNPIMIDGTGMCGACRLTVGGETKFACIDGPDFDGHMVDFDEAIKRNNFFKDEEKTSRDKDCNLMKKEVV